MEGHEVLELLIFLVRIHMLCEKQAVVEDDFLLVSHPKIHQVAYKITVNLKRHHLSLNRVK